MLSLDKDSSGEEAELNLNYRPIKAATNISYQLGCRIYLGTVSQTSSPRDRRVMQHQRSPLAVIVLTCRVSACYARYCMHSNSVIYYKLRKAIKSSYCF